MRAKFLYIIVILLVSVSLPAYALEGRENIYASLLLSGDKQKVISAANSIYFEKSRSVALLDIVAELLWLESTNISYVSSDVYPQLIRALGNSQFTRYEKLLKTVDANLKALETKHKPKSVFDEYGDVSEPLTADYVAELYKARKHIAKWLPKLRDSSQAEFIAGQIDFGTLTKKIDSAKHVDYLFKGEEYINASLLLSGENPQVILAAKTLYFAKSKNIELLDIVAELLWLESKPKSYMSSDGLAWMVKALGNSRLTRYQNLLKIVDVRLAILEDKSPREFSYDDEFDESSNASSWSGMFSSPDYGRVRSYVKRWLPKLRDSSYADFIEGKLDFQALSKRVNRSKQAGTKDINEINLTGLRAKNIDQITAQAGLPDSFSVYFRSGVQLQLNYGKAGIVQLIRKRKARKWRVYRITSLPPEGFRIGLLTNDPASLRQYAQTIINKKITDTDILDIAAKRIWDSKNTEDQLLGDAMAWLCKSIGESQNSRYRIIMEDISVKAKNEKITRYCKDQLVQLTVGDSEQYVLYKQ